MTTAVEQMVADQRATPADPGPTLPPARDGETAHEAVRAAIAWEYRRRAAGGVAASPEQHANAFAWVSLAVLWRGGWLGEAMAEHGTATVLGLLGDEAEDLTDFIGALLPPFNGGTVPEDSDPEDFR